MNWPITAVLAAAFGLVVGAIIPERIGLYAALVGGLVTFCGAVAGGVTALLSDEADTIARATAIGAGFGGLLGLVLSIADAISR